MRWRRDLRSLLLMAAAVTAMASIVISVVRTYGPDSAYSAAPSLTGSAGADTSLPLTDSTLTKTGRGLFAGVSVTVNQTKSLTNQAVSVTWTGAPPGKSVANNFFQIFQCWGDDDGSNPDIPGPPPQQCEFGGEPVTNVTGSIPPDSTASAVFSRVISKSSWGTFFVPSAGVYDAETGNVWMPFKAVDGKTVDRQITIIPTIDQGAASVTTAWQNPYFDFNTTNEKPWARTYGNGKGAELFQVDTGLEAPGLGCGQKKQTLANGTTVAPKCWLVVVPRGTSAQENPPDLALADPIHVLTSPLSSQAWANRIVFPLDFNPVDSPCALGNDERRIVGSEYAVTAISSWQPKLCEAPGAPPYAFSSISDNQARQQLVSGIAGAPGMAVVSRPFDPAVIDPADPVVYAPLTLSGVVIGFNIERVPTDANGAVKDPAERDIAATRVSNINLTPRLVAKLLTQSYSAPFVAGGTGRPTGYEWLGTAKSNLTVDPDFQQFNPEFTQISVGTVRTVATVTVEASSSDAARTVWEWILADKEAKAWLDGAPDPWGMVVNPYFATKASANRNNVPFADPVPDNFPKNDPYCYQDPGLGGVVPRPLCLLDIEPYGLSNSIVAQMVRAANNGSRTTHDPLNPSQTSANTWWGLDGPQPLGRRSIASITDSASAYRFGLQTASLSRAGDDGATRAFIAADDKGFTAAAKAMVQSPDGAVLVNDPSANAPGAYPLPVLTYAAALPKELNTKARADYGSFVSFATSSGQTRGVQFGQLPPGYAPLPAELQQIAKSVATSITSGVVADPSSSTTATTTTPPTTTPPTTTPPTTTTRRRVAVTAPPTAPTTAAPETTTAPPPTTTIPPTTTAPAPVSPGPTPVVKAPAVLRNALPGLFGASLLALIAVVLLDDGQVRDRVGRIRAKLRSSRGG